MITYKYLNLFYVFKLYYFLKNNKEDSYYFHPHRYDIISIFKILFNKKDIFIVQILDKKIIGYGMLRGWRDGYDVPRLGLIIDKNYRGMGYSKKLLSKLHDICKLIGIKKVTLKVMQNNNIAIKLYEKNGYVLYHFDTENLIGEKKL